MQSICAHTNNNNIITPIVRVLQVICVFFLPCLRFPRPRMERGGGRLSFTDTCRHRHLTCSRSTPGHRGERRIEKRTTGCHLAEIRVGHLSTAVYTPPVGPRRFLI